MTTEQRDEPYWWTPRLPRRGRRIWVPLVVVALLALAAWPAAAAYARAQVHVLTDVEALTCTGTEVAVEEVHSGVRMLVADIEEEMRCELRFRVENRGRVTVDVTQVRVAGLWPGNGSRVVATELVPFALEPRPDDLEMVEAIFDLDHPYPVPSEETVGFSVALAYSSYGCAGEGNIMWLWDTPTVTVRALGIPGQRHLRGEWFGLRGTETSGSGGRCDDP